MNDSNLSGTVDRIDRALSRIEAAARARPAPANVAPQQADAGLQARHDALRLRVQETIDRLDTLIGAPGDR